MAEATRTFQNAPVQDSSKVDCWALKVEVLSGHLVVKCKPH